MKKYILTISCALGVQITTYAQPGFGYTAPTPSYNPSVSSNFERFQNAYAEIAQQRQLDAIRAQQQQIEAQQQQIERQIRLQK
jgi:hypothetical protein